MSSTTFDDPPEYDAGDRVVTVRAIGPVWARRVRAGGRGIVVARAGGGRVAVRFAAGVVEEVDPASLLPDTGG